MAISNPTRIPIANGLSIIMGAFDHVEGEAPPTLVVDQKVFGVLVGHNSNAADYDANPNLYSTSVSGALTTITFRVGAGVSSGTFIVFMGHRA